MKKYNEYLYNLCNDTDLDNKDEIIETMNFLANEALRYHDLTMEYEKKLKTVISAKDFEDWSTEIAKKMFMADIERTGDQELIDFVKERIEEIEEDGESSL